jgi:hypothetical protein
MFGSSERNDTDKKVQILQSQSEVFYAALVNSDSNDLVFIGNKAIRKSFIHCIEPIKNATTHEKGVRIRFFSFELKKYEGRLTDHFDFWESEITFDQIKAILEKP